MGLFAFATLAPVGLIALAALYGGPWGWAALGYITVLVFVMDKLVAREAENADPEAEFPAADQLLVVLGFAHLALLALSLWAVAGPSGLATLDRCLVALAAALLFGQISHPVAHELIHRSPRAMRLMGRLIYTSVLMGHHASAHMLIHHVHVGSNKDPNSPPRGMGFWRYAPRAWWRSFTRAYRAETRLRRGKVTPSHPYVIYTLGGAGLLAIAGLSLGLKGIAALSEESGLPVANVFYAGDGNMHPLILFDANREGELALAEDVGGKILELCVAAGGSITGEHGVGVEKIRQMAVQFNDEELQQFHDVKAAFDPAGILNPGKGVPALRFCQEYRSLEHKQHTHEHREAAHG